MAEKIIAQSIMGSHLYGLAHPGSDLDMFQISLDGHKPLQTIENGFDKTIIPLDSFVSQLSKGSSTALEFLFSPIAYFDKSWEQFLKSQIPNMIRARDSYRRRIAFHLEAETLKGNRHAMRLAMNLEELEQYGRFNPMLSEPQKKFIYANEENPDMTDYLKRLFLK